MKQKILALFLLLTSMYGYAQNTEFTFIETDEPYTFIEKDGLVYMIAEEPTDNNSFGKVWFVSWQRVGEEYKYKGDIVIPSEIQNGDGDFADKYRVVYICADFSDCEELTSVEFPDGVKVQYLFFRNTKKLKKVKFPSNLKSLNGSFLGSGIEEIVIPSSVKKIEMGVFQGCENLTRIEIPNSVTSIGKCAFSGCASLASIEIPNSVTSIGEYAFSGCTSLASIEIPNSVTCIGEYAFMGCTGLASIEIPNSVTCIGNMVFYDCSALASIEIPNSVTGIGEYAFSGCTSLASIEIPNSVTGIGEYAFYACTDLKNVKIGNSVTSIGKAAFSGCTSLASIEIPNSTQICNGVFHATTLIVRSNSDGAGK